MTASKQLIGLMFFLLIFVSLLVPYPTTSIPEWHVTLVYEDGSIAPDIEVRQEWSHSSTLGTQSENKTSDTNGNVVFPERRFYAPLLFRGILWMLDLAAYYVMPHGSSIGPHARVVSNKEFVDQIYFRESEKPQRTLLIRRSNSNTIDD